MLSKKSIRRKYLFQLIIASTVLLILFAIIIYLYVSISAYDDIKKDMQKEAISYIKKIESTLSPKSIGINKSFKDTISTVIRVNKDGQISFEEYEKNDISYMILFYPYDKESLTYIRVQRDITNTKKILSRVLQSITVAGLLAIILILVFAIILSDLLLSPIHSIAYKLSRMNENFLDKIDIDTLPDEFVELGESINKLIHRIQNFVKYQRELFVGIAHELKTPLSVMKTKNEVTLMKDRDVQKYKETLKINNQSIDSMNKMISSILEVGRQEGAQFEPPIEIDMIQFLKDKVKEFTLLAKSEGKHIESNISPQKYTIVTQPTLLTHILQNFVQNAIKFTPPNGTVKICSKLQDDLFTVQVIDEGEGIDETQDLFAPFKRFGDKSGAGLGLFLAKGAADTIGATLSLKNRTDNKQGCVATLIMDAKNYCPIEGKIVRHRNRKMIFSYPLGK